MTEDRSYVPFSNGQTIRINSCDCVSQNAVFDLEKYGLCHEKIRALFVPNLEDKIHSLLKEFFYGTDSRWAKQLLYFKKFLEAIATWKNHSDKAVEYNISAMKVMRNIIKCVVKDNLLPGFLDSIILHHRLSKISREIDELGIESNILSNKRGYWMDCNSFTNHDIATECSADSSMAMPCDAKVKYRKNIKPQAINDVYCDENVEHIQTTSEYRARKHRQVLDSNQSSLPQKGNNSNYSTYDDIRPQNYDTDKIHRSFNEKSCNTKSKEVWTISRLKIIVFKMYLDDYDHPIFSKSIVTHLPVPCKPNNLIGRIFEADPSLTETCLIMMKRKFRVSIYNICSCLNDVLRKLDARFNKTLCLNCEIHPGYINFKLKTSESSNVNKCLFVARMLICQNVRKRTVQQNISPLNSKPHTEVEKSKCKHCKNDDKNFNDTNMCIDEENEENKEKLYDTCCLRTDRGLVEDVAINMSERTRNNSENEITCKITEDISEYIQDPIISSRKSCDNIIQEISNVMLRVDNLEEKSEEHYKVLDSIKNDCNCDTKKRKKEILDSGNSIIKNDDSTQPVNDVNCMCSSNENLIEMNDKIQNNFDNKDSFSQTTGINEHDCSSDKESNLENEDSNANTYSIASFVQNFERDKQLVELNCNCFSNNNIKAIDKRSDTPKTDSLLNLAKVEVGCDSSHFCRHGVSKENLVCTFEASQDDFDSMKAQYMTYSKISSEINNSLTISVQTSGLEVSSQGTDKSHPQTVVQLACDDRNLSTITKTRDRRNETTDSSALIIPKKGNPILHNMNKKIFNVNDRTCVIKRPERFTVSKGNHQSNGSSNKSSISTEEYLRMEDHSVCMTSNTSRYCRSFAMTREFATNNKRNEFRKFRKSRKLSKLRGHASSSNGIRDVTSFTTMKTMLRRCQDNDYSADVRPRTMLTMTKFRDSINRSIERIKRLISTKLGKILFNNGIKITNTWSTWQPEESSEDTTKEKTSGRCIRQGYNITSCSISDCCKRSCIISSRDFSNVILSFRRNRGKKRSKVGMKFYDYKLVGGSKISNLRSIKTPSWCYDLSIPTSEDLEKWKLDRNSQSQYNNRKEKIRNKRNNMSYNKNSNQRDFRNYRTRITISSESTEISLIKNDPEYSGRYARKQWKGTCDNKCVCKQVYNRDRSCGNKKLYQEIPIEYISDTSNKSLRMSSSYT